MEETKEPEKKSLKPYNYVAGIASALWYFNPSSFMFLVLMAIPVVGIFLSGSVHPERNALIKAKDNKPAFTLPFFIIIPTCVLGLRMLLLYEVEGYRGLIPAALAVWAIAVIALFLSHKMPWISLRKLIRATWEVLAFLLLYGYLAAFGMNIFFDQWEPKEYQAKVIETKVSTGKGKSTRRTYYAIVQPWGPYRNSNEVMISEHKYSELKPGDSILILRNPGFFDVPWNRTGS